MKLTTLAKILGGLVALIVLALVAVPFFISADYLKSQLVAQVKNATGRDLMIKGKTSLALFPNIAVSAEDVTLSNPAGFTTPYFVHIAKLETGAALGPLLSKQLSITGLTLDGAEVNLEQNASGAKNWEFASVKPAASATPVAPTAAKKSDASPLDQFRIGDITLSKSAIKFLKPGAKPLAASDMNITLHGADGTGTLKLDAAMTYQGQPVQAHLTLDKPKPFLAGQPSPVTVKLALPETNLDFAGQASQPESIKANGKLNLTVGDLPKLLTWATGTPAASSLPKKISLKTDLGLDGMDTINLQGLTLSVDQTSVNGDLALNVSGAVPSVKGKLHAATLNLDAMGGKPAAAPAASSAKTAPTTAPSTGWSDAALDLSGLRAANANLGITIDKLVSGKLEISSIAATVALQNGVLKLTLGNAALYQGTAKGDVTLDGSGKSAGLATHMNLSGIAIDPLMTALDGTSRLKGTTTLNLVLNGNGSSQRALVSSLGGTGAAKVTDGAIKGVNIAQFLRNAKQGALFSGGGDAASTDFTELTASFTIAQGIVTNNDLAMKSPILRVAGEGTVNLPAQSLNYRLTPTIVGSIEGQGSKEAGAGLAVPLIITGPWSNPSVTPDVASIVKETLKDPKAMKQNLKNLGAGLKDFNSPKDLVRALFGGKKAQ